MCVQSSCQSCPSCLFSTIPALVKGFIISQLNWGNGLISYLPASPLSPHQDLPCIDASVTFLEELKSWWFIAPFPSQTPPVNEVVPSLLGIWMGRFSLHSGSSWPLFNTYDFTFLIIWLVLIYLFIPLMGYEAIKGSNCCFFFSLSSFPPEPTILSGITTHSVNVYWKNDIQVLYHHA